MEFNMRFVIQRVNHANVKIDGEVVGNIGHGLLILFGAGQDDTEEMLPKYVDKICKMRIFEDENGKTNLSLADVGGELLIVSQFTLYADCRKGNRPSFVKAGAPAHAEQIWNGFNDALRAQGLEVKEGRFGSHMRVRLANDGPVTIILDTDELGV